MTENNATQAGSNRRVQVNMIVNGSARTLTVEPRMTLLDELRDELGLTGPKKSCDRGECGACTVHIEDRRILSCMTLAAMHNGQRITTIRRKGIRRTHLCLGSARDCQCRLSRDRQTSARPAYHHREVVMNAGAQREAVSHRE